MQTDKDLKDLIDSPKETLAVELKSDLDLDDPVYRADLACHICAMANYGGGFIVFGFDNSRQPAALAGNIDQRFHPDRVSAIVNRYLAPAVLCGVTIVTSEAGHRHPIIRVPSHDTTPVCPKADGPQDAKGRVQGIVSGRHYTRQVGPSGPESVPITRPDQWIPIIRRCVSADRTSLMAMIDRLLNPQTAAAAALRTSKLDAWHDAAAAAFLKKVDQVQPVWPTSLAKHHYQLSYEFIVAGGERIPGNELMNALERANAEMRDLVWTGWSMFYPFRRPEIAPYVVTDAYPGQGEIEVLEASLIEKRTLEATLPDFWRIANDGKATIVRAYREDRTGYPLPVGKSFSPFTAARELAEIVRHGRAMTKHLNIIESVRFRCEWRGLQGREWRDPGAYVSMTRTAKSDRVVSVTTRPPEDLTIAWPSIVSELLAKLARVFDPNLDPSPEWVQSISPRFRDLSIPG